jgi:UDP-N-acetylmuramyl pentapeptide phosphotransferase/UDP-N-acetylglucosamine-1-phosphate transferase
LIPALLNVIVVPPLLALMVTAAVIAVLMRSRVAVLVLDHPNQRSLHAAPTPRLGGIGLVAGVAAAWAYAAPPIDLRLLVALALLVGVSLLDDLRSVGVPWRLTLHFASALLAMAALLYPAHGIGLTLAATLAAAWLINLYNFMDGADGLAGGMAVFGFGAYGLAALAGGDFSFAALNLAVAAAALGFLLFNFPPARVFMGDVGAIPLGYLAAVLDVAGWLRGDWPLWFGAIVFSPFIVDATCTLMKRLARGAKVWQAHREHYYQRLVQSGWGHRKTAFAEYGLMALTGGIAFVGIRLEPALQVAMLIAVALLYSALIVLLERRLGRDAGQHV